MEDPRNQEVNDEIQEEFISTENEATQESLTN